jgi:hypothetical protein
MQDHVEIVSMLLFAFTITSTDVILLNAKWRELMMQHDRPLHVICRMKIFNDPYLIDSIGPNSALKA